MTTADSNIQETESSLRRRSEMTVICSERSTHIFADGSRIYRDLSGCRSAVDVFGTITSSGTVLEKVTDSRLNRRSTSSIVQRNRIT